jgi:hypothetical protein
LRRLWDKHDIGSFDMEKTVMELLDCNTDCMLAQGKGACFA